MKKRFILLSLLLVAALLAGTAAAAGGDAGDPLVSLDYLTKTFSAKAEQAAQDKIDAAGSAVYESALAQWRVALGAAEDMQRVSDWTEARLKHGDILSGATGTEIMLLAGEMSVQFSAGAIVDATEGNAKLTSGSELKANHHYIVAEDTAALFTVISRTAVLDYRGDYHLSLSNATTDYSAMASALKALDLFKGTDTAYGEGFDLELQPTRIQALVMLIRLLGEEDDALACTAPVTFKDIPATYWGRSYIAYAVEKGYTNGVEDNQFAPDRIATTQMYIEFVLRALGYSDTTQSDISGAAQRALTAGVITSGEKAVLEGTTFLRADVVYLSWYALEVPVAQNMQPLHTKLESMGVFTAADYQSAKKLVTGARL